MKRRSNGESRLVGLLLTRGRRAFRVLRSAEAPLVRYQRSEHRGNFLTCGCADCDEYRREGGKNHGG